MIHLILINVCLKFLINLDIHNSKFIGLQKFKNMILYNPDFMFSVFVNPKYDPTKSTDHELYYCRYIEMLGLNNILGNDIFKAHLLVI